MSKGGMLLTVSITVEYMRNFLVSENLSSVKGVTFGSLRTGVNINKKFYTRKGFCS